ncbi:MAG TPA: efflux RND transporter periplasmic adaptor subunit [Anaerolineales bacterium]|nr:efflux RND transporter periplasmic adaptor subunit [Anaerolineales bacterium]
MNKNNFLKGRKTRYWIIGVTVVLLALFVLMRFNSARASNASAELTATVVSLDVAQTVEASGSLDAQPSASLTWDTGGVVDKVYVQTGDKIKAGDVLMKLKTSSVSSSIISAQADLVTAQKDLENVKSSSTDLSQAVIDLKDAQEAYDKAANYLLYLQNSKKVPQSETRLFLETKRNSWMYVYKTKTFKGPAPQDWITDAENDLALKTSQLEDAQRTYDRLKEGSNSQDVVAAQAKVDAAQATVNSMSVIAPFDGEVLYVKSQPGDVVEASTSAINVANLNHLYVETQVDESDVANVKVGQPADVTLDALTGVNFKGKVMAMNPVGEVVSGLVKYAVRVDLDKVTNQNFIPLGTTANVVIHVKDATASLAVPITTVQNDSKGEYVLVVQGDGSTKRVDVVSGSIVGNMVVVTGDLQEGEQVQSDQQSSFSAPNPFRRGQ